MSIIKQDPDKLKIKKLEDGNRSQESTLILTELLQTTDTSRIEAEEKKTSHRHPKLGNLYTFFYKNSTPRIILGPQWYFYIGLIVFMFFSVFFYLYFLWHHINFHIKYSIIIVYILQLITYSYTSLCNPGIHVSHSKAVHAHNSRNEDYKVCGKCYLVSLKADHVEHCTVCNVCYIQRDHHCAWTSKCIAKGNLYTFYGFVTLTLGLILLLYIGVFGFIFGSKQ